MFLCFRFMTHHNDSEIVRQLRLHGRVVEPLEDFHKNKVRALDRELGSPAELLERHPFPGPGLSVGIIYAEEPFSEVDFDETQVLIRLMVPYANIAAKEHALLNRIEITTSKEERILLEELSSHNQYVATLLPIRTVGVQVQEVAEKCVGYGKQNIGKTATFFCNILYRRFAI
ncbi:GMP synthase [glutamine-hydrolyzing]-like [Daphnia magna]|uniref:GMP synthase [glutamine-hydrolyzing]-like n=1 Tax=Daphnia magna TaxID=35525 RepID=UPI001E1BAB75|nr:GMP synthase [glutamine-hydrolyzing]-like [Daphnia magna]XP_045028258.1 GMP synthase [glutamine-hydrolyzing]-like [Daphnia magna]XP_045028259.1 GMP synthase [glutamine-hydrolyzing]-like [Daphnia magna]